MDTLVESELKSALGETGCAVCRVGEESASRYLRFLLHESVNDVAVRRRLLAAWGFCRRHAWHFIGLEVSTMRDGLGNAMLAEGLLEAVQLALDRRRSQRVEAALAPKTDCPACVQQKEHEAYALSILVRCLADTTWQTLATHSGGLCLSHFRSALTVQNVTAAVDWLLADYRRRVDGLLTDLKEYIRKHDYRFSGESPGAEQDSFRRGVALLAGPWFELPGRPKTDAVCD